MPDPKDTPPQELTDEQKAILASIPMRDTSGDAIKIPVDQPTPGEVAVEASKALGAYQFDLLGGFHDSGFDPQVMQKLRDNGVKGGQLCEGMMYEVMSVARELHDIMPALAPSLIKAMTDAQMLGPQWPNTDRMISLLLALPGCFLSVMSEMERANVFNQERASKMHERFVVTRVNLDN